MKTTLSLSAIALVLSAASFARAETFTPTNDTYVRNDGSGPYGSDSQIYVKDASLGSANNRIGLVRFAYSGSEPVSDAALELTLSNFTSTMYSNTATFTVWGIENGSGCGEAFNEDALVYSSLSAVLTNGRVDTSSACLWDADPGQGGKQPIGSFTVTASQIGHTFSLSTPELARFLEANTNGRVAFIIARNPGDAYQNTFFASKEHASLAPPTLKVSHPGVVDLADIEEDATQNADGSWHFEGDLPIPIAGGLMIAPGAEVDMTFDGNGHLQTISGTAGTPELPGSGLWSSLGGMSSTSQTLQLGYDYPSAFDTLGLPLDAGRRYFYFLEQAGASVSWGPVSCDSPGAGSTLLAIEPEGPTVFTYTDQLLSGPIGAIAIGVSGDNSIPYDAWYETSIGSHLGSFDGDFYLGGSVDIPTEIPALSVNVTGDVTVDVNDAAFASGSAGWMKDLGTNSDLSLVAGLGPFSVTYYLAGGSLRYHHGGTDWLAFSGVAAPDDLLGLPYTPKAYAQVDGYLTEAITGSYLHFDGEMKFGTKFAQQKISGESLIACPTAASCYGDFEGTAKFSGTTVSVSGSVHSTYAVFTGSLSHDYGVSVSGLAGAKIEADIDVSFDSRHTTVDLDDHLKLCWHDAITGKHCDSVGGSVTVNGSGQLKICANTPSGTKCDTLS